MFNSLVEPEENGCSRRIHQGHQICMYKDSLAQVKTSDGCSDYSRRDAGLHHGSDPSPLLLIIAVSALAIELGSKPLESL